MGVRLLAGACAYSSGLPGYAYRYHMGYIFVLRVHILSGHSHLAEPGCLCTKQALGACASKLLENRLGPRRRTSYLLTASGVGA